RPRFARPHGVPARAPGQARLRGQSGLGGLAERQPRGDSPLLRDRRAQHLADLPPLCAAARPRHPRAAPGGDRARESAAARLARAPPRRVPRRLGDGPVSPAARSAPSPAEARSAEAPAETATVSGLTRDGEGVVRAGKTVFVAGARPPGRVRFPPARPHRPHAAGGPLRIVRAPPPGGGPPLPPL